jgi:dienelactone hydrolase
MRFLKRIAQVLLVLLGILLIGAWYLYTKDYRDYFLTTKGKLTEVREKVATGSPRFKKSWLTLMNDRNFAVECGLLVPRGEPQRYPAIILLGGKATGKYAIDYALDIPDIILIAVDYPYEPRESYTIPQFLSDVPAIRTALFDMIPSVMLVADYLWERGDVDTTKIVLLGYSFGAPFVPCLMANDHRPAVAAIVYGGGDLRSLIAHNVNRYEGKLMSEFVGVLSDILLHPLEPLQYADRISPAPLVMINGVKDEQIPRWNTELLFNAAREPKKQVWLESKHVNPMNVDLTKQIVGKLKEELRRLGVIEVGRSGPGQNMVSRP